MDKILEEIAEFGDIKREIARLRASPPSIAESPVDTGRKLVETANVLLRLAEYLTAQRIISDA